jgi:hypothetical protein
MELEAANSAGSGMRMFGDVLGGLGRVGTAAGLSGGFGGLGSAAGAPLSLTGAAGRTAVGAAAPLTNASKGFFNFYGAA